MNYRTATDEQLRQERVRLNNMLQMVERRREAALAMRAPRDAGFRRSATPHQQDRELIQIRGQIERLNTELTWRETHAKDAAEPQTASAAPETAEARDS
jgi:hypothetical protein